ncbi:MAG: cytochrome c [Pirellulales bacterium]|nr:cytochrome c [Pirellulales bacterium]
MLNFRPRWNSTSFVLAMGLMILVLAGAAGMPEAPPVSSFAPADDLVREAEKYVAELAETVAAVESGEETYNDVKETIEKDANALIVVALCLGKHDRDNKFKASAGSLMKAAQEMAATKDFAAAKKALAGVQDAAAGKNKADIELKWEKVASLPALMKHVPALNTKLKNYVKPARFKAKSKDAAGITAVLAAVAQGSMADAGEAKSPEQVEQWRKFCQEMRNYAAAMNESIRAGNVQATGANLLKLGKNCEDCHAVFHPEAKIED